MQRTTSLPKSILLRSNKSVVYLDKMPLEELGVSNIIFSSISSLSSRVCRAVKDMSIIICAHKVAVKQYWPWPRQSYF